jgi:hypothetical protein
MKPINALLYELTAEETERLPEGFQFLEYDTLTGSLRVICAGIEQARNEKRYVYLCYKEPPASFNGDSGKGRSKLACRTSRTVGSSATCIAPHAATNTGK